MRHDWESPEILRHYGKKATPAGSRYGFENADQKAGFYSR
jgi:hypothetical protein